MDLRQKNIDRCREQAQDCLVIGAGINGAVAAAALAGKGASVTVVDRGDFSSLTSQESSNLAWGGIKYLENGEFRLVWKLCGSRNDLMELYPSQVEEIRFLTCIPRGFRKSRLLVYLGALLYWVMGRFQTRPPVLKNRAAIGRQFPMIKCGGLSGAVEYSDCILVENDSRFTFGFIRQALAHGANAVNYLELASAARSEDGLWHCQMLDRVTGRSFPIKARCLINAAGPFADDVGRLLGVRSEFRHLLSKGVHLIVPQLTDVRQVMAFFASDGRLFFMIPMGQRTCIGTTDLRVGQANVTVLPEDVCFILKNANDLLDLKTPLTENDIIATRCGVRPLVTRLDDHSLAGTEWTALSRKHEIHVDHPRQVLSIYGGKLTDCINVGNEIASHVLSMGLNLPQPDAVWYGEPGRKTQMDFRAEARRHGLSPITAGLLWRRYGAEAPAVLARIAQDPAMGETLVGDYLRAEFYHIASTEMVVHLEDFLRRRSMLSLVTPKKELAASPGLKEAANILFGERASQEWGNYFG